MNIYTLSGKKVVFTGEGGYDLSNTMARDLLEIGKEYTVDHTEVNSWYTNVFLKEMTHHPVSKREVSFNTVMFTNVEEQGEDEDKKHPDYKYWNKKS